MLANLALCNADTNSIFLEPSFKTYRMSKPFWLVKCHVPSGRQGYLQKPFAPLVLSTLQTVRDVQQYKHPGDFVGTEKCLADCVGWFTLVGENAEEIERDYARWRFLEAAGKAYEISRDLKAHGSENLSFSETRTKATSVPAVPLTMPMLRVPLAGNLNTEVALISL